MAELSLRIFALLVTVVIACASPSGKGIRPPMVEYPVLSEERVRLTREYAQRHYGIDDWRLNRPSMVVIHYSAFSTLGETLKCFAPSTVSPGRKYIRKFGNLNVGVHFVVDRDGTIYSLLPENMMGRHAIGFNHVAFGIENVGRSSRDLTRQQVRSNALLVRYLVAKYPEIRFLVGHQEYTRDSYPHYSLYTAIDTQYRPTVKIDPGENFMKELRDTLKNDYIIILEK